MKKTPDGKVHNCATHVEHAVLGKGVTVSEQHAEPDANGEIEWYTVQFENSIQKVLTKDLTITVSESHEHKSKKDNMEEAMSHQAATTMKHIPNASPALKKAAKDIKPGIAGYRDRVAMLKAGGVKEEVEQKEYTFAEYLTAAREQYGDEEAVEIANEAFKNKDITLFIDQSQSPEA